MVMTITYYDQHDQQRSGGQQESPTRTAAISFPSILIAAAGFGGVLYAASAAFPRWTIVSPGCGRLRKGALREVFPEIVRTLVREGLVETVASEHALRKLKS